MIEENNAPIITSNLLVVGETIQGRFRVLSSIAAGGQAEVFLCEDLQMSRQIALKVIDAVKDDGLQARFKQEVKILASLKHPNIVTIYASGILPNGSNFLAMEYVEGETLELLLREKGKMPSSEFFPIFSQLLRALEYLHSHGVLHRDLKPANILIRRVHAEASPEAKLLDFGIAKILADQSGIGEATTNSSLLGTPNYMSPERCQEGELDARSDLYSLSCVMYEALSGKQPFAGASPLDVMYKQAHENLPPIVDLHKSMSTFLKKGLEKEPEKRHSSAAEMLAAMPRPEDIDTLQMGNLRAERRDLHPWQKLSLSLGLTLICVSFAAFFAFNTKKEPAASLSSSAIHDTQSGEKLLQQLDTEHDPRKVYEVSKKVLGLEPRWNKKARLSALYNLCSVAPRFEKDSDSGLVYARMQLEEAIAFRHENEIVRAYLSLANSYQRAHSDRKSLEVLDQALDFLQKKAKSHKSLIDLHDLYFARATAELNLNQLALALKDFEKANAVLGNFSRAPDHEIRRVKADLMCINLLIHFDKFDEAKRRTKKLLEGDLKQVHYFELPIQLMNTSQKCLFANQPAQAKYYLDQAEHVLGFHPDDNQQKLYIKAGKAFFLAKTGKRKEAESVFRDLWSQYSKITLTRDNAVGFLDLQTWLQQSAMLEDVQETILKSVLEKLGLEDTTTYDVGRATFELGLLYLRQNKLELAEKYLNLSLEFGRRVKQSNDAYFVSAAKSLHDFYKSHGKIKEADALKRELMGNK